ncbi:hypothetical protein ACIHIX_46250 [Streptomyces sp. NPDC051913]|uniref:hypothetical protein n=1 Tax=Streptomyces sp. NPDC051913 TaxID=3365676 RepID=UPI0037D1848E
MTHDKKHPETAVEEVLREFEETERRTQDSEAQRRRRGEPCRVKCAANSISRAGPMSPHR